MAAARQRTIEIRQFITHMVASHPSDIALLVAQRFEITPQAARNHLNAMVKEGSLRAEGRTKAKTFLLVPIAKVTQRFVTKGAQEDLVWAQFIRPLIDTSPKNVLDICGIATSEMINNVIDHSGSEHFDVTVTYTPSTIDVVIRDYGVGVFKKVQQAFGLIDERQAILELSKGKLTTAPKEHSGYGIFFTSRMVDLFKMWSGSLFFTHVRNDGDWLVDSRDHLDGGTFVEITISTTSTLTARSVYDKFCNAELELGLSCTHVPLKLAEFGMEILVSRSQAKRVLARFDRFNEVMLDFRNIDAVGQGFIDEIFRVFAAENPKVKIMAINTSKHIDGLIELARNTKPRQLTLFQSPLPDENMQ